MATVGQPGTRIRFVASLFQVSQKHAHKKNWNFLQTCYSICSCVFFLSLNLFNLATGFCLIFFNIKKKVGKRKLRKATAARKLFNKIK